MEPRNLSFTCPPWDSNALRFGNHYSKEKGRGWGVRAIPLSKPLASQWAQARSKKGKYLILGWGSYLKSGSNSLKFVQSQVLRCTKTCREPPSKVSSLFTENPQWTVLKDKLKHILKIKFIWTKIDLNQAASNLADKKEFQWAAQNKRFIGVREQE